MQGVWANFFSGRKKMGGNWVGLAYAEQRIVFLL
jgi:hypothetical protein